MNECLFSKPITDRDFIKFKENLINKINEDTIKRLNNTFEKIEKDKRLFRYYLKHIIKDSKGTKALTVIAMNPSTANENETDPTIENIEEYLKNNHKDYKEFIIFNIFPIRIPESEYLQYFIDIYKDEYQINDKYITEHIEKTNNDILLAWGSEYHKYANVKLWWNELTKKNIYVGSLNKDYSPKSFSSRSYNTMEKNSKLKKVIINSKKNKLEYLK